MNWLIKILLKACTNCHGMGSIELPNGDTKSCFLCKGKGTR